ncbi:hypothetical protein [Vibrio astriarenae]|uniref:hypothetical protein n=1 Tax=Vibrio astriarenae TaxID=1481923 RepID=UPI003734E60B
MGTNKLDELFTDDFLDSLDDDSTVEESNPLPAWVVDDKEHTTYRVYHAILELKAQAETAIDNFGEVETKKTPKFYKLKKASVARTVGLSAQSIFNTSSFSPSILNFFNGVNDALLERHQNEQKKQLKRKRKKTGLRAKTKEEIVGSHQCLETKYNDLKAIQTEEVLNLAIERMPIDLRAKLGL